MTIALWRAFEFTPGCEWIALLWNIPEQMRLFLGVYHVTRPELNRNGFVTKYLNYCIQSFCQVFGKYSSTIEELETCADHFRVDIDTPHFRRAENVLRSELNSNIETLMAAHKGRGVVIGSGKTGKTSSGGTASSASDSTKGEKLCFKFYTTKGCARPGCHFLHKPKPTEAQVKVIRQQLVTANNKYPASSPLVVDEAKV